MTKHIQARVAGRLMAREIQSLLEWEDGTGADYAESFLDEMRKLLPKRAEPEPPRPKWNNAQLAATVIPFGMHEGVRFDQAPEEYLQWLVTENEKFYERLRAYLKQDEEF